MKPKVKLTVQNLTALILKHESKTIRRPTTCLYRPVMQPQNNHVQSNEGERPTVQGWGQKMNVYSP